LGLLINSKQILENKKYLASLKHPITIPIAIPCHAYDYLLKIAFVETCALAPRKEVKISNLDSKAIITH
jgi:hypothetical protein